MDLHKIKLFHDLDSAEQDLIFGMARKCTYPKGATVFTGGQKEDGIYIIYNGRVKVTMLNPDGREKTLAVLSEGELIGEVTLLGDELRTAGIETLENTTFLIISRRDFISLMDSIPILAFRVIEILSKRLRRANRHIEELTFLNARNRVICALVYLSEEHGLKVGKEILIFWPITHAELAKLAGVTRETVTKVFSELQSKNLISTTKGRVRLMNPSGLHQELL